MKKLFAILLTAAALTLLCACGASPAPAKAAAPQPAEQTQPAAQAQPAQTAAPAETQPAQAPAVSEDAGNADAEETDALNEYGLPDLSGFTAEEIWDMYLHPENWDASVLTMADSALEFGESEPYADPEIDPDYTFDLGDWHDYDPGDWTPGPDEVAEYDTSGLSGGEAPALPAGSDLPEDYAFLLPEGLRDGDATMRDGGMFALSLPGRSAEDFETLVQRARDAGYTQSIQEMNMMGMRMFEAGNGRENLTILLQNGTIMVSFE